MAEHGTRKGGLRSAIGPGVLFAGAAVGVSHLVQSTRAGASYGLALLGLVVLANVVKYPAFRFGPHYAAGTGCSLLEGYRRQGRWALAVYGLLTVGTMFTVQAAVTLVTAGLMKHLLSDLLADWSATTVSGVLIGVCALLLAVGGYRWLDRISKVVVTVLALGTLVATIVALPRVPWDTFALDTSSLTKQDVFFMAALVGWMPSAIDVAVWQSLWTLARRDDSGHRPTLAESTFDFHGGYVGTAVLAVLFVLLGAAVMHGSGHPLAERPHEFAGQFVDLYVGTLGGWSRPVIALSAFLVMFSTTLTVVDGFPRALTVLVARFRAAEDPDTREEEARTQRRYWVFLALLAVGSMLILAALVSSLSTMVDLATTLSFLTAPVLALLNHRAVTDVHVPDAARPAKWLLSFSLVGIVVQAVFALGYLWLRFGS